MSCLRWVPLCLLLAHADARAGRDLALPPDFETRADTETLVIAVIDSCPQSRPPLSCSEIMNLVSRICEKRLQKLNYISSPAHRKPQGDPAEGPEASRHWTLSLRLLGFTDYTVPSLSSGGGPLAVTDVGVDGTLTEPGGRVIRSRSARAVYPTHNVWSLSGDPEVYRAGVSMMFERNLEDLVKRELLQGIPKRKKASR